MMQYISQRARVAPATRLERPRRIGVRPRPAGIFPGVEPSKQDIVEALAKARTVERLVENITRRPLDALTRDLAQTVYVYLLEFPEDKLQDLHRCGELTYFIVRIIINQWAGSRSTFRHQLRKFSQLSEDIDAPDIDGKL